MVEKHPKRPTEAKVDFFPVIEALSEKNSELIVQGIATDGIIDVTPLIDYVDSLIAQLSSRLEKIEQFHREVIEPSHRHEKPCKEEPENEIRIEESLAKIKDLTGEARKQALRKLILKSGDENE